MTDPQEYEVIRKMHREAPILLWEWVKLPMEVLLLSIILMILIVKIENLLMGRLKLPIISKKTTQKVVITGN